MGTPTTVTKADVILEAPEFTNGVSDAEWSHFLAAAGRRTNSEVFGEEAVRAAALLCAHMLTKHKPDLARRDVTSVTVGKLSKTYVLPMATWKDELDETKYGRERKMLGKAGFAMGL